MSMIILVNIESCLRDWWPAGPACWFGSYPTVLASVLSYSLYRTAPSRRTSSGPRCRLPTLRCRRSGPSVARPLRAVPAHRPRHVQDPDRPTHRSWTCRAAWDQPRPHVIDAALLVAMRLVLHGGLLAGTPISPFSRIGHITNLPAIVRLQPAYPRQSRGLGSWPRPGEKCRTLFNAHINSARNGLPRAGRQLSVSLGFPMRDGGNQTFAPCFPQREIRSLIRLAKASNAKGLVSTCMPGSRCPWLSTAFSA